MFLVIYQVLTRGKGAYEDKVYDCTECYGEQSLDVLQLFIPVKDGRSQNEIN